MGGVLLQEDEIDLDAFSREQATKAYRTGKPVFLRKARREGWTGELPLYLLYCPACRLYTVTHPAGYGRIGCLHCRETTKRIMTPQRFRDKVARPVLRVLAWALAIPIAYVIARLIGR